MESKKAQYDIVYIKNTKKLRSGMVTDEFADDLILASDNVFCKRRADAFSSGWARGRFPRGAARAARARAESAYALRAQS